MTTRPLKVLLADDHALTRRGLRETLEDAGLAVVAEAADGAEALTQLRARSAEIDVAVLDLSMGGPGTPDGLEVLARLRAEQPGLGVVIFSMHPEDAFARRVMEMGAHAYVSKSEAPERIVEAVCAAAEGRRTASPTVLQTLLDGLGGTESTLSGRELQVVRDTAQGRTPTEIARALGVSPKTVETHRRRARGKLGVRTDAELTRIALRRGWVE